MTLVELILVLAIIALLAALLAPVLAAARAKSRQSVCASNMRQIAGSILLYSQDYDEVMVPAVNARKVPDHSVRRRWWPYLISPYVRAKEAFYCPSDYPLQEKLDRFSINPLFIDQWPVTTEEFNRITKDNIELTLLSFGANCLFPNAAGPFLAPKEEYLGVFSTVTDRCDNGWCVDRHIDEVVDPSSTLLVAESYAECCLSTPQYSDLCGDPSTFNGHSDTQGISFRHSRRANVVFVDGHISALHHTNLDMWAVDPRRIHPDVRKWIEVDHCK